MIVILGTAMVVVVSIGEAFVGVVAVVVVVVDNVVVATKQILGLLSVKSVCSLWHSGLVDE